MFFKSLCIIAVAVFSLSTQAAPDASKNKVRSSIEVEENSENRFRFRVGERAINIARSYVRVEIIGIQRDGKYIIEFLEGELRGRRGGKWSSSNLAKMRGCHDDLCVGDRAFNVERSSAEVRVAAIQENGEYVLDFMSGELRGRRGGKWDRDDLAVTFGCGRDFCVGDHAINLKRNHVMVRVLGVQVNGKYVLEFLEGELRGKIGGKWRDDSLARVDRRRPPRRDPHPRPPRRRP